MLNMAFRNAQPQKPGKVKMQDLDPLGEVVELNPQHENAQQQQKKDGLPVEPPSQQQ